MMHSYRYTWIITGLCFLTLIFWAFRGRGVWLSSVFRPDWLRATRRLLLQDNLRFDSHTGDFYLGLQRQKDVPALAGVLFANAMNKFDEVPCNDYSGTGICIEWQNKVRLSMETETGDSMTCRIISWSAMAENVTPRDCFFLGDAHWYGGAEVSNQRWPIERGSQYEMFPFLPGGDLKGPYHEDLLERYWLSSKGIAIKVDDTIPLFVSWNASGDGKLCLTSLFSKPYQHTLETFPSLKYHICQGGGLKNTHIAAANKFFAKPGGMVDTKMILSPIWSTWAKYHKEINQPRVLEMAKEILSYGYTHSQIEIDDMFTSTYGAMDFDQDKFPNATEMVSSLKSMGLRVTAWFHPFINVESPVFLEGIEKQYFVQDLSRTVPALVAWWDGVAAVLDVTNPQATKWFSDRLKKFQDDYKIDSFKFDAGSAVQFPSNFTTHSPLNNTAFFTTKYIEMSAQFGPMVEVRSGFCNQNQPVFFRLQDMDSTWDFNNGLKSLIPRVLYFGLVGYPFVLPDMIGGNAYDEFPERELFIRWMQVSAFMPSWQFSITPGQYDNETIKIAQNMMALRETFLKPYLLKSADEAVKTGAPIARPLWWLSPTDATAQTTETQFLVGNDVMVAPVLDKGVVSRDVYIPAGRWRDQNSDDTYHGPTWIRNHPVPLYTIAYFVRIQL